jgi:hypothetical protein
VALGMFLTNRGLLKLMTGAISGATNLRMALAKTATDVGWPAASDTQAEINDFNTVTDLITTGGVVEVTGGSYARQLLTSVTVTEDDTNDRVNIDAADATFTAVPATQFINGGWIQQGTGVDGDDLIGLFIIKDGGTGTSIPANGSNITATIADFARLTH